jgi:hypothetical protein
MTVGDIVSNQTYSYFVDKGVESHKEKAAELLVRKPNFPQLEIVRLETCSLPHKASH